MGRAREKAATEMARRSATEGCLDGNSRSPMNVFNAELMNTLMDSVLQADIYCGQFQLPSGVRERPVGGGHGPANEIITFGLCVIINWHLY